MYLAKVLQSVPWEKSMSLLPKASLSSVLTVLVGGILAFSATPVSAQFGPVMSAIGPINRSMGGAATGAPVSASGAIMWNPATLSKLSSNELDVGGELIVPHADVYSQIPANTFGPGFPPVDMAGSTGNENAVFAVPTIALSYRPEESPFTFGMGAYAIAGFGLNYPGSLTNPVLTPSPPVGLGFGPIFSQYQVMQIAPALVYDVTDRLSVSFSPLVNIGMAQLDPALFASPDDANGDGFPTYPSGTHSTQAWGAGYSLGIYYQADNWGLGASYKSRQWFQDYQFSTTNEIGLPQTINFGLDLPAIISLGGSYRGIDGVLLAADVRYLDFENTSGFGDSGFSPTGAMQGIGLQSIVAVSVGAQFEITDAFTLRTGYSWSDNPVTPAQASANVASPLVVQNVISAGCSYQLTEALVLSFCYSRALENSVSGPLTTAMGPIPGTLVKNSAAVDMYTLGATVKF